MSRSRWRRRPQSQSSTSLAELVLFFILNREDFSFVIHLDRQPRTSRRREAQTGSRARSGSRSERTLDAVEHSRTLMEWWPFLIFHRGGLRIKVINNKRLIAESCRKQDIEPDQLTLHADRGSSMRSKPVGLLLADLGVTKTHSRPYVSNDNPYSESQFKTMKYCPQFPSRFGSAEERPAILLRFLRLLQFSPPALGNRPYDTGRRSLWSSRTAHHRSAPDPSRSSTGLSRTLRSRNAATARFASAGLDQPAAGKNDPPRCRTSPSRGGVHTWGTPFFCFTQRDLDRC